MDVHWTGRTILSRQRILKANLDISRVSRRGQGVVPRKIQNLKSLLPGKFALQWLIESVNPHLSDYNGTRLWADK